ncbi:TetR family transcriptional regulator [Sphingobium sp. DEHP117]|uniref:TetR/AcrR family transcriptional regulator n=1 Tax=Sphingobium sp. DEHP117 TaxID=2993436 RepID=UPI0027D6EE42|nr:hypothetical protein [Sphingobium sp. DEHP117]MDQ4420983.1 TetR family transcriptional regulator [Sphingobium sp. DEHP117]
MSEIGHYDLQEMQPARIRRRKTKQTRSYLRQKNIALGAISAISEHGIAALTHRRVAKQAHVSLAATTYYYETKNDIIKHASQELLDQYVHAFQRFERRYATTSERLSFREFALKLVSNALGRHRAVTLAWCEITLNAAHEPNLQDLTQNWFRTLNDIWQNIAHLLGEKDVGHAATSAIDTVVGFIFLLVPLGLSEDSLRTLLSSDVTDFTPSFGDDTTHPGELRKFGKKAEETRERILRCAVALLTSGENEPLTFRKVAEQSGLTVPALTYHFSTVSDLLNAAQMRLFIEAKFRYRTVRGDVDYDSIDVDQTIDMTTKVFLREVTEHRDLSLAAYPVYIQSSRDPRLRPGLWAINAEQWHGWSPIMTSLNPSATPFDAWFMAALFTGKLIRIIVTGGKTNALSKVHNEFAYDLHGLVDGRHWAIQRQQ